MGNVKVLKVFICLVVLLHLASTAEAISISPEATDAIEYANEISGIMSKAVDMYRIFGVQMSPVNAAEKSGMPTSSAKGLYDNIFGGLEHNQEEARNKQGEFWEQFLCEPEERQIRLINEKTGVLGQLYFGEDYPNIRVGKEGIFSLSPRRVMFIIPAFSGVVVCSSNNFDDAMRQYLIQAKLFFPIFELRTDIPEEIIRNRFFDQICYSIRKEVPEVYVDGNEFVIRIYPPSENLNYLVSKGLEEIKNRSVNTD